MPRIALLLHKWTKGHQPVKPGPFPLGDNVEIPDDWELPIGDLDPSALPTPFARAEVMTLILERLAKSDEAAKHEFTLHFASLLLGIATGELELEPQDLLEGSGASAKRMRYHTMGPALERFDRKARYFARVVRGSAGAPSLFGVTHRTCLLWPSANPNVDWNGLERASQPRKEEAMALLADWRESLRRAGRWRPELAAWQRGVNLVAGEKTEPSDGLASLNENSRFVGPILLSLPTGAGDTVSDELIYLPTLERGFASRFRQLLRYEPRVASDGVVLADSRGVELGRVTILPARQGADLLALGSGSLSLQRETVPYQPGSQRHWDAELYDALRPLCVALEQRGRPCEPDAVRHDPTLYPDPVRLILARRTDTGLFLTARAKAAILERGLEMPSGDEAVPVELSGRDGANFRAAYVDRIGDIDVLDLRALGLVVYCLFVGEAELEGDGDFAGCPRASPDVATLTFEHPDLRHREPMLVHSVVQPFEPAAWVYECVERAPPAAARGRLAQLQRFVATYDEARATGLPRLLALSARSFARWAYGGEVHALGVRATKKTITLNLPGGYSLPLARDAFH